MTKTVMPDASARPSCRDARCAMHDAEDIFIGAQGKQIPVSVVTSPLRNGSDITGAVVTFHDIYERQSFQQALHAREQRQLLALSELMNTIHQQAMQGTSLTELLQVVCEHTASLFRLDLVLVGQKQDSGKVEVLHAAGPARNYLHHIRDVGVRWDSSRLAMGPTGMALKTGRPQIMHRRDEGLRPWRQGMEKEELMSVMSLPIFLQGQAEAVLVLYSADDYAFANQNTINDHRPAQPRPDDRATAASHHKSPSRSSPLGRTLSGSGQIQTGQ